MSLSTSPDQLHFAFEHQFVFEPIPDATFDGLDDVIADIALRRQERLPTYGAMVFRACSLEELEEIDIKVRGLHPHSLYFLGKAVVSDTYDAPLNLGFHWDPGSPNSITRHSTTVGRAEVAILCEAEQQDHLKNNVFIDLAISQRTAEHVFDRTYADSTFDRALHTVLNTGDVLLFDHSQPHAFRSLTTPRVSDARYYNERLFPKS